jgi:hypothetical protein
MNTTTYRLEKIVKETYNTEFRLSFNGKEWKIYIVASKTMFTGPFDKIIKLACDHFEKYKIPTTKVNRKNQKYFTIKYKPEETKPIEKPVIFRKQKSKHKDNYTLKLEFSQSLGHKNFTECFNELGAEEFKNQFNKWNHGNT